MQNPNSGSCVPPAVNRQIFTKPCRLSATSFLQMTPSMHRLVEILRGWQPWPFPHVVGGEEWAQGPGRQRAP